MIRFKTNARCAGCSAAIKKALAHIAPEAEWDIDLTVPDRILTYNGADSPDAEAVVTAVENAGFKIEPLV